MVSPTLDLSFGAIVEVKDGVVALLVADNVAMSRLDRSHVDDCCLNPWTIKGSYTPAESPHRATKAKKCMEHPFQSTNKENG